MRHATSSYSHPVSGVVDLVEVALVGHEGLVNDPGLLGTAVLRSHLQKSLAVIIIIIGN